VSWCHCCTTGGTRNRSSNCALDCFGRDLHRKTCIGCTGRVSFFLTHDFDSRGRVPGFEKCGPLFTMRICRPPLTIPNHLPEMFTTKPSSEVVEFQRARTFLANLMRGRVHRTHRAVRVGQRVSVHLADRAVCVLPVVVHRSSLFS
jgi:hypothetical protein